MQQYNFLTEAAFERIRRILFYFCLLVFFLGLPFILTFALGYKFNYQSLKFVKTGLIYIKTQPEGAKVYINGKLFSQKSPTSIQELLPGVYKIVLELAAHYPWKAEVDVEAGKVSRIDKVIFFPLRPVLEQLNREKFSSFRIDLKRKLIYYLDQEKKVVYRSNFDASNFEDIASLPEYFSPIDNWNISPDEKKFFIYNAHQIAVLTFDLGSNDEYLATPVFLDYDQEKITNVFWHSDSYHLVVLTNKYIQVIEARALARPINLVELNKENAMASYDQEQDLLFFGDSQIPADNGSYNNLYKLELSANSYLFDKFIKGKVND